MTTCVEGAECDPRRCALGPPESDRESFEQGDGGLGAIGPSMQVGQCLKGGGMVGIRCEGPLVGSHRLFGVAELLVPDATELRLEGGALVGRHLGLALDLRDLEHEIPLAGALVEAAKLPQGRPMTGIEAGQLPIGLAGADRIEDPLLVDLGEAQEERDLERDVGRDGGGRQSTAIEPGEILPASFEEELLLAGLEGPSVVGIPDRDLVLRRGFRDQERLVRGDPVLPGVDPRAFYRPAMGRS